MSVIRCGGSGEHGHSIKERQYLFTAFFHLFIPKFEVAAIFFCPVFVKIDQDVKPAIQLGYGMFIEIGVEFEHSPRLDLVAAAAVEKGVRDQVLDAAELGEEFQEGLRIQIMHESFGLGTEPVFSFGGQFYLVRIIELNIGYLSQIREFI